MRWQGKWGYVDKNGQVVVPFLYDQATLFDGNWASVRKNGRYAIIDKAGAEVTIYHPLAKLSRFSGGLAVAKAKISGQWGYVDETGAFVIQPQFDSADEFSSGLAAVSVQGTWFYVTPSGTIALVTPYYRAYAFTEDGLALVQEKRDGRYGYIDRTGQEVIPPQYPEARRFSQGLAPVRVGDRWGYITTSGATAISPRYTEAYPFVGGRALVLDGLSSYFFIDSTGERAHDSPFVMAESFSDGVAIVGDGLKYWYVDEFMTRLPVGEAVPPSAGDSGACGSGMQQGVSTNYVSGLTFFQIVNMSSMKWTTNGTDTWAQANPGPGQGSGMTVNPGLPALVDSGSGAKSGQYTFLHQYNSFAGSKTGTYPLFDLTMTSGTYTIKLSNAVNYTQPPPPPSHPWWDYLSYALDAMEGLFSAFTGNWAETAIGIAKMVDSAYDIASGTADNQGNNNDNIATDNVLATTLTVTKAGSGQLAPLDGGYCGGDSYTVSDGANYVFSLTTVKSKYMPPTIQLTVTPWSTYFAQNAQGKLDMYRRGNAPGVPAVATPLAGCVYAMVFENFTDTGNSKPCVHPSAFPTYNSFTTASNFSPNQAESWWNFANNLNTLGTNRQTVAGWLKTFGGACGTLPSSCPSVSGMTVSPPSCEQTTLEQACSCAFKVTNPNGPVFQKQNPQVPQLSNNCATEAPYTSPCTITLALLAGSPPTTVTLSDNDTDVPVSLTCTAQKMTVQPLTYTGTSYPDACIFTVQVAGPTGPVSATPATWVKSNTCTGATSGTCVVSLSVPSGTPATSISLSDGKTTQPISVECKNFPMSIAQTTYSSRSTPGGTCAIQTKFTNTHGPVTLSGGITTGVSITGNSCTGSLPSCELTVNMPPGGERNLEFSDGGRCQEF